MDIVGEGPVRTYCLLRFEGEVHKWTVEVQVIAGRFLAERCFQRGCEAPLTEAFGYQVVDITEAPHRVLWTFVSCEQHLMLLVDAVQSVIQQLDGQGEQLTETTVEISHRKWGQYGPLKAALIGHALIPDPKALRHRQHQAQLAREVAERKKQKRLAHEQRMEEARERKAQKHREEKERQKAARTAKVAARQERNQQRLVGLAEPALAELLNEGIVEEYQFTTDNGSVVAEIVVGRETKRLTVKGHEKSAARYRERHPESLVVVVSVKPATTKKNFREALSV